ncbi:MAG: Endodeoxyribonuclease RusA [Streptosporangiaceae bacterium]|nr:Endodeoxyribonuclease RusA [Streptosporangiaceae bacterium]
MTALFDLATPAPGLAPGAGTPPLITIALPAGLPLLNSNQRLHHRPKAKLTAALRAAAMEAVSEDPALMAALAAAKPGPLYTRAHILGILHPPTRRRADPANWYPSFKAAVDGIVDAGVLEDDDHTRVIGPDMRIGTVVKGGRIVLVVRGLEPGEQWPNLQAVAS